jgi:hypothetical protein
MGKRGSPGGREDKEGKNIVEESSTFLTIDSPRIIMLLIHKKHLVNFMDILVLS